MTEVDDRPYSERFATPKKGEYQFDKVPLDDPRVYAMIGSGRTQGCFQIESKLGKDWSRGIKPSNLSEISDLIALIRPGCLESGMTETYKNVKRGTEELSFYHPALEPILKSTKGVLIYQEQILEIAKKLAGFSEPEADELRRCITQDTYFISKTRGWITIKRLLEEGYKKDLFLTMDEYGNHHWDEIDEIWSTGSKATHLVETETGLSITTSLYHQFLTNNGWKCKRRLNEDDWLITSDIIPYDGEDKISSNMAYIIACILTEGYFPNSNRRGHFCNWEKEFMRKYTEAYEEEFGEAPKMSSDGKYAYIKKKHKDIIKKILSTGLSRNKKIPDVMMGMTLETTRRFLSAMLYAEGSVVYVEHGSAFGFSSASLDMAKQVKMLMMRFGIRSIIESKWNNKYNQYYYNVSVTPKYDQEIILNELMTEWSEDKKERFKKCVERKTAIGSSNMRRVPRNIVDKLLNQYPYVANYEGGSSYTEDITWEKFSRLTNRSKDKKWIKFTDESKHSYEKITTVVKDSNSRKVYDFRMKNQDRPQIVANGILIHNCVGKKDAEKMMQMKDIFISKAEKKGTITKGEAEEIFSWIQKSARYSFNASHSVSYGMTTYYTTYAKVHYPTEFFCSYLMFSDLKPDPKEEIYTIVNEAKSFGISIVTPSVILLNKDFKITKPKEIAFGLYHIRDVGESAINRLLELGEKIKTPMGFLKNITEIGRKSAEALVKAGACDTWGIERMSLLKFINVVYGYSSKEADKNLNLKHLSKKELDYFDEHFNEIGENLMTSLIGMLNKIIEDKACMTKRVEVIRNKIEQCKNCGQDTNLVKSAWEKVYLGINISCSAADDIIADDGLTCKKIFDYEPENYKTEKFKVYCTIDKVHNKITGEKSKNPGQEYCYIDISDSTLALSGIVCWPEQYQKFKDSINEGALACVTGRWTRYKDSKQFTLLEIQEISA